MTYDSELDRRLHDEKYVSVVAAFLMVLGTGTALWLTWETLVFIYHCIIGWVYLLILWGAF